MCVCTESTESWAENHECIGIMNKIGRVVGLWEAWEASCTDTDSCSLFLSLSLFRKRKREEEKVQTSEKSSFESLIRFWVNIWASGLGACACVWMVSKMEAKQTVDLFWFFAVLFLLKINIRRLYHANQCTVSMCLMRVSVPATARLRSFSLLLSLSLSLL